MVALYRSGRPTDALAVYRQTSEFLARRAGAGAESRRCRSSSTRSFTRTASLELAPHDASREAQVLCPFKGLASFDRSDAEYFCGRERIVSELIARLAASPLVGIVGASGMGKFVAVEGGGPCRSGRWRAAGQRQLATGDSCGPAITRRRSRACPRARRGRGGAGRAETGEGVVIAVDQLEELFTVCEDADEPATFLDGLAGAARDSAGRALVVVALRADFYGRVAGYPGFAELLSRSHVLVGPMDREELARAIEERRIAPGSKRSALWLTRSSTTSMGSRAGCRCSRQPCSSCGASATDARCDTSATATAEACRERSPGSPRTHTLACLIPIGVSPGRFC